MDEIKNLLFYGGLSREEYEKIIHDVADDNRKHLIFWILVAIIPFTVVGLASLRNGGDIKLAVLYLAVDVLLLTSLVLCRILGKKYPVVCGAGAILNNFILLFSGIINARVNGNERVTLFLPFLIISSVIFCVRPIWIVCTDVVAEILFLLIIFEVQSGMVLTGSIVNSVIFCFVGMFCGIHLMKREHRNFYTSYKNIFLIERDQLTGAYNRRKFDSELIRITENHENVTVCMFDLDGLKSLNDSKGHSAGDELIVAASKCIQQVYGKYGNVFRTGGDEFVALLDKPVENIDLLKDEFAKVQAAWKGNYADSISISSGTASVMEADEKKLNDAILKAEKGMYCEKRRHYQEKGIDRRGRSSD